MEFSADQRFVVIQAWGSIRVVDIGSLQVVWTFSSNSRELIIPVSIHGASINDLFLISYATKEPFRGNSFNDLVNPRIHNELVDVSTGQLQSSWESLDIPQSLSADGKIAAVSDWGANNPLVEIEIVDTQTGKKLKTLHSAYRFKKPWRAKPTGRVNGRFLGNDVILLSPDEHVDSAGHRSGETLKLMRVSDGRPQREFRP